MKVLFGIYCTKPVTRERAWKRSSPTKISGDSFTKVKQLRKLGVGFEVDLSVGCFHVGFPYARKHNTQGRLSLHSCPHPQDCAAWWCSLRSWARRQWPNPLKGTLFPEEDPPLPSCYLQSEASQRPTPGRACLSLRLPSLARTEDCRRFEGRVWGSEEVGLLGPVALGHGEDAQDQLLILRLHAGPQAKQKQMPHTPKAPKAWGDFFLICLMKTSKSPTLAFGF